VTLNVQLFQSHCPASFPMSVLGQKRTSNRTYRNVRFVPGDALFWVWLRGKAPTNSLNAQRISTTNGR